MSLIPQPQKLLARSRSAWPYLLIFGLTLLIYERSPVTQLADSCYTLLLSETILHQHTFQLDASFAKHHDFSAYPGMIDETRPFQIEQNQAGHYYYLYPPGSSLLSIPLVAAMNLCGLKTHDDVWHYDLIRELKMQRHLAAFLMAALASLLFFTLQRCLPFSWSMALIVVAVLGTQYWSTASRALWSCTWGVVLLHIVIDQLIALYQEKRRLHPLLLGTVTAWLYYVRPTFSIAIITISLYLLLRHRRYFLSYAAAGAAWAALFFTYSSLNFGQLLPAYYQQGTILKWGRQNFWEALPGILLSPSRGLFIFLPWLFFLGFLLLRHFRQLKYRPLLSLALANIALSISMLACWPLWWGGSSYGPRLLTSITPWLLLCAMIAVRAFLDARESGRISLRAFRLQCTIGLLLAALSVAIHARGALCSQTWTWSNQLDHFKNKQQLLWQWSNAQFLAGLVDLPLPPNRPRHTPGQRIDFTKETARPLMHSGWSVPESEFCWSEGRKLRLIWSLAEPHLTELRFEIMPFLAPVEGLGRQRVMLSLNGRQLAELELTELKREIFQVSIPDDLANEQNVLELNLPDAASPYELGLGEDTRLLALKMYWLEMR